MLGHISLLVSAAQKHDSSQIPEGVDNKSVCLLKKTAGLSVHNWQPGKQFKSISWGYYEDEWGYMVLLQMFAKSHMKRSITKNI